MSTKSCSPQSVLIISLLSNPDAQTTFRMVHTTSAAPPPRYNGPDEKDMTEEQQRIRQDILSSRPRTGLSGPFGPWLACPSICEPAQVLGRACRYGTSLSFCESELIILLTAAKTKCSTEFELHQGEALLAGWSLELIHAIPRDDKFSMQAVNDTVIPLLLQRQDNEALKKQGTKERLLAMVRFCAELLDTCTVSDDTYTRTLVAMNGKENVLVEMTSIVGYYTYVAYTLNVFRIPSK
jgi:4-carboxymuconolactone decarboxylase